MPKARRRRRGQPRARARLCSSLLYIVVHGIYLIPTRDHASDLYTAAVGCFNTFFTSDFAICNGCPETGVLDRTDSLGFGYRPTLLGSVHGILTRRERGAAADLVKERWRKIGDPAATYPGILPWLASAGRILLSQSVWKARMSRRPARPRRRLMLGHGHGQ
jgi:hypothetical protein